MLTVARTIDEALLRAKAPHYTARALENLNSILSDLSETYDLALSRGVFSFNFNPNLATIFGSGPYKLPVDYLRTSGSTGATGWTKSVFYNYPTGVGTGYQPMFMTSIDLAQFDALIQQVGNNSLPALWATDMGGPLTNRIVLSTTTYLVQGSTSAVILDDNDLYIGLGMAGEGVQPGTELTNVADVSILTTGDTHFTAIIDSIPTTAGILVGQLITSADFEAGTRVLSVDSATQITATASSLTANAGVSIRLSGTTIAMSIAATLTQIPASVFFGIQPVGYAYPPPLGPYPVSIRYQRKMPQIFDMSKIPWFPNEGYLIRELAARMCEITDDTRANEFRQVAANQLSHYLAQADDKNNRAQQVQMDGRQFGQAAFGGGNLRSTKTSGW